MRQHAAPQMPQPGVVKKRPHVIVYTPPTHQLSQLVLPLIPNQYGLIQRWVKPQSTSYVSSETGDDTRILGASWRTACQQPRRFGPSLTPTSATGTSNSRARTAATTLLHGSEPPSPQPPHPHNRRSGDIAVQMIVLPVTIVALLTS
ncbi:hypothetical protein RND81_13G117700 [Saponaria officinalis]|uniref:Uncharacterized protein n=1 Tax=Saponaria officinalis TaxID=3572 RepID=A0AAW1GZH9_SAPOF